MRRRTLASVLAVLGLALPADGFASPPETLVSSSATIVAAVQDGVWLAWSERERLTCQSTIVVRSLASGQGYSRPARCPRVRALAGERVFWLEAGGTAHFPASILKTATPEAPARVVEVFWVPGSSPDGDVPTGLEANGSLVRLSRVIFTLTNYECFDVPIPCVYNGGGRVERIVGRRLRRMPDVPAASELALGGGRIAILLAPAQWVDPPDPPPRARAGSPIEIRDARTGSLVTTYVPSGRVLQLALTRARLAVLARASNGSRSIDLYDPVTGALLRSFSVASEVGRIDMAGDAIVYRRTDRNQIRLLDAETGERRVLAWPPAWPNSLSIDGRRVVWVENGRVGSRVVHRIRRILLAD